MKRQKGFTLIELLVVVGIILIIAAIAIPNLLRSKVAANESSAVASVRTIGIAESIYSSSWEPVTQSTWHHWAAPLRALPERRRRLA